MKLLIYTGQISHYVENQELPLAKGFPRKYPWTQMCNRVLLDQIDPFHYTLKDEPYSQIASMAPNTKTFEDMCLERAQDLLALSGPLYVMWSGGIDSSAALVALLRLASSEDIKRIHIVASYESYREFPAFWKQFYQLFQLRIHSSLDHPDFFCRKGWIITGEHGDQIFGSDIIRNVVNQFGDEGIHAPWTDTMPAVYTKLFDQETSDIFIDRYQRTIEYAPFKIKTSFDWVWWFNFTNKWQHVKYRLSSFQGWNPPSNAQKIKHFFDTPDWQRWSLDNHDKKIQDKLLTYKFTAKDFIIDYVKDEGYRNKEKIGSLQKVWSNKRFCDGLDIDLNPVSAEQCYQMIRKDE